MSRNKHSSSEYRSNYLQRLCSQNTALFQSPYVWAFSPDDLPLNPRQRFPECERTFLEIGFGHGEVLEKLVSSHSGTGFVGIERRPVRVRKALKRLERINSDHVFLMRVNLELLQDSLFVPDSFDEILINHPDPWPKRRHQHHRFLRPQTMDWLAAILIIGGSVEVASDHARYFFHILRLFEEDPRFESILPPPFYTSEVIPGRLISRFERKKRGAGMAVRILKFNRTKVID